MGIFWGLLILFGVVGVIVVIIKWVIELARTISDFFEEWTEVVVPSARCQLLKMSLDRVTDWKSVPEQMANYILSNIHGLYKSHGVFMFEIELICSDKDKLMEECERLETAANDGNIDMTTLRKLLIL